MSHHLSHSGEQTAELGRELGRLLGPGEIVLLSGDLGTGKTTFARGICQALGVTEPVTSPTFTIGQIYVARTDDGAPLEISHLDLYRLEGLEGEDPALLEDYLGPDRLAIVEWPGIAVASLFGRVNWHVEIEHAGGDRRRLTITPG